MTNGASIFEFAPMEGITTWVFRQNFQSFFPGIHRYYTPFLSANQTKHFKNKELREILTENNQGIRLVPQVMSNKADEFVWAVEALAEYGYREINLNLGCPFPTVVSRGKGSGFLADLPGLDRFFDETCRQLEADGLRLLDRRRADAGTEDKMDPGLAGGKRTGKDGQEILAPSGDEICLTVKTRIGLKDGSGALPCMEIFNRYPLGQVIIHPRTREDMYENHPHREVFRQMLLASDHPVGYNGDILTPEDAASLQKEFPDLFSVMLGRGLLRDPSLLRRIQGGEKASGEELFTYLEGLYHSYAQVLSGDAQVLCRLKEIWWYLGKEYPENARELKEIRKAKNRGPYQRAVEKILL